MDSTVARHCNHFNQPEPMQVVDGTLHCLARHADKFPNLSHRASWVPGSVVEDLVVAATQPMFRQSRICPGDHRLVCLVEGKYGVVDLVHSNCCFAQRWA